MTHTATESATSDTADRLGHPRVHLRRTDSTNDRARELAIAGAPHGTLVSAGEQTAGRGRQGRRWSAPPNSSVLMSLLLRHTGPPPRLLPLQAALAVCDVVGDRARIKWPNDIVLEADHNDGGDDEGDDGNGEDPAPRLAKLAGILIEGRPQEGWSVLGIGLNVAVHLHELPEELQGHTAPERTGGHGGLAAATLGLDPSDVEPTLERLLATLQRRLLEAAGRTLEQWRERDALLGRHVAWSDGAGRGAGVDEEGRMLIQRADGSTVALGAGEVHLLRVS